MQTTELLPIKEGKTKRILPIAGSPARAIIDSKDDITAGDGARHDVMNGKAALANRTTCNVFRLLQACHIPIAFEAQDGPTRFIAQKCQMLPCEVVVRREAHGSYLKRSPHLAKGHLFPKLVLEFFLKTSGRKWNTHTLPCDDPLMHIDYMASEVFLYDPKQPIPRQADAQPFLKIPIEEVFGNQNAGNLSAQMGDVARLSFLVLEKAWQLQGRKLVDFKVEFGIDVEGRMLLADVIDNDSWRVIDESGKYIDKQVYRDGGEVDTVAAKYREVADITDRFEIPKQRVVLWRGSDRDNLESFYAPLHKLTIGERYMKSSVKTPVDTQEITCSVHKQPATAYRSLQKLVQEVPDTVIVAFVGMSNGAGPTLAANTTVPVITVPATYKEFENDVWSSLCVPSNVPVMTILEPANAMLAALQILAMRNPGL